MKQLLRLLTALMLFFGLCHIVSVSIPVFRSIFSSFNFLLWLIFLFVYFFFSHFVFLSLFIACARFPFLSIYFLFASFALRKFSQNFVCHKSLKACNFGRIQNSDQ